MFIVSACLIGNNCRYDGRNNYNKKLNELLIKGLLIPVCPEQMGGMTTPREPHEIIGGTGADVLEGRARVISIKGSDSTINFIKGAEETLKLAKNINASAALLKSKSPSCGVGRIYDGTFSKTLINGNGVTAELLLINNIKVFTEEDIEEFIKAYL